MQTGPASSLHCYRVPLALAAVLALSLSTIFSATWPFGIGGSPLGWQPIVFVWVFSIVVFLIQDRTRSPVFCMSIDA